jgi:hypothetical protein
VTAAATSAANAPAAWLWQRAKALALGLCLAPRRRVMAARLAPKGTPRQRVRVVRIGSAKGVARVLLAIDAVAAIRGAVFAGIGISEDRRHRCAMRPSSLGTPDGTASVGRSGYQALKKGRHGCLLGYQICLKLRKI